MAAAKALTAKNVLQNAICVRCGVTTHSGQEKHSVYGALCTVCFSDLFQRDKTYPPFASIRATEEQYKEKTSPEKINPAHYKSDPSGVEAIQVTRHRVGPISNALKYLWRAGRKEEEVEADDLNKVLWYVADYMQMKGYAVDLAAFRKHAGIPAENYVFNNGALTLIK